MQKVTQNPYYINEAITRAERHVEALRVRKQIQIIDAQLKLLTKLIANVPPKASP